MKYLGIRDVIVFHEKIIRKTGGREGVRDLGLIESAISRAFSTFDGQDLYLGLEEKISGTTYGLIKNHGFIDGNKRIGISVMLLLLKLNKIDITYTQRELVNLGLRVAEGSLHEKDILKWINDHKK